MRQTNEAISRGFGHSISSAQAETLRRLMAEGAGDDHMMWTFFDVAPGTYGYSDDAPLGEER